MIITSKKYFSHNYELTIIGGGNTATFRNFVIINGKPVELKSLTKEEQKQFSDAGNRKAANALNYKEVKTA